MIVKFKQVFKEELKAVSKRRGDTADTKAALPPLRERLTREGKESKVLLSVLDTLIEDGQSQAWDEVINSEGATSGSEGTRSYAGHPGLIGLAFSGGGIRSATFNLGVYQALEKCGLLSSIDYLSTVSGGGYLGSCLSSLNTSGITPERGWFRKGLGVVSSFMIRQAEKAAFLKSMMDKRAGGKPNAVSEHKIGFPFKHEQGCPEPVAFLHLRNNANYLAPKGILDLLRMPALLLRGVLVNLLVILPYILLASIITILIFPPRTNPQASLFGQWMPFELLVYNTFAGSLILLLFLVIAFAFYPLALLSIQKVKYFGTSEWKSRDRTGRFFGFWIALIALVAFLEFQPLAILWFSDRIDYIKNSGLHWKDWAAILGTAGSVLSALSAGKLAERISGFAGKLGLYLLGLLGFLLLWLIYLNLCRWAIIDVPIYDIPSEFLATPKWLMALVPYSDWLLRVVPDRLLFSETIGTASVLPMMIIAVYAVVGVTLGLYSLLFVDVNYTSLHNFYRDRLSKAYLIRFAKNEDGTVNEDRLAHNDTQNLSSLNSKDFPYHLINAAINLKTPDENFRRGRQADTFVFSKFFIGSPLTDYCRTKDMERARSHVNLGTAMAVSGAAFAATAGKATIKPLAFIMALLNVRLNYWLPNPRFVAKRGWLASNTFNRAGPSYLINELLGRLDADSWNVDISDGGHFENLGIYELLRRECRLIIAGDGECDPELKFDAVSEVVRLAQIDMGIKIEIKGLDKIRAGRQHHAIGTIHYSKGRKGVLIYLKSSLLKDDSLEASLLTEEAYLTSRGRVDDRLYDSNPYIAHYKAKNPSFPHQTTGDQFFDEKQFECYRALGYMVTMRSIGNKKTPRNRRERLEKQFLRLKVATLKRERKNEKNSTLGHDSGSYDVA